MGWIHVFQDHADPLSELPKMGVQFGQYLPSCFVSVRAIIHATKGLYERMAVPVSYSLNTIARTYADPDSFLADRFDSLFLAVGLEFSVV